MARGARRTRVLVAAGGAAAWLLGSPPGLAQHDEETREDSAAPVETPAVRECYPACRAGFVCYQGQCISECNPPCSAGQVCVQGARCEAASTSSPIYEPPPPPPPKGFASRAHTALAFHLGLGGNTSSGADESDLDSTFGASVRSDFPVVDYLLLGPLIQVGAWRPDVDPVPARSVYVDIDFYLRARYPFDLDPVDLQVWVGVPIGLSFSSLAVDLTSNVEGFGIGWNYGGLAGGAIHFTDAFGLFAEGGLVWHDLSHHRSPGTGNLHRRLAQSVLNVGFMLEY